MVEKQDNFKERIKLVQLDVSKMDSILKAKEEVENKLNSSKLIGLVNNAGVFGNYSMEEMLNINVRSVRNMTNEFSNLMENNGNIVNIGSGSASMFVQDCNEEYIKFFLNENISWKELEVLMTTVTKEFDNSTGASKELQKFGLSKENGHTSTAYGFSKAILNSLTMLQAKELPNLKVNACTPGFIKTDMTFPTFANGSDEKAKEMGMKSPHEGAFSTLKLLKEESGSGFYFGSDGLRSPLHKYRQPGSGEYKGEL